MEGEGQSESLRRFQFTRMKDGLLPGAYCEPSTNDGDIGLGDGVHLKFPVCPKLSLCDSERM